MFFFFISKFIDFNLVSCFRFNGIKSIRYRIQEKSQISKSSFFLIKCKQVFFLLLLLKSKKENLFFLLFRFFSEPFQSKSNYELCQMMLFCFGITRSVHVLAHVTNNHLINNKNGNLFVFLSLLLLCVSY